jgi:hypothetical protein
MNNPGENPSSKVTVKEEATEYVYRFDPPISISKLESIKWGNLNIYGGFAQLQASRWLGGGISTEAIFAFPKTAYREDIIAIFDRLRQGKVVNMELTTEKYPSKNPQPAPTKNHAVFSRKNEIKENIHNAMAETSEDNEWENAEVITVDSSDLILDLTVSAEKTTREQTKIDWNYFKHKFNVPYNTVVITDWNLQNYRTIIRRRKSKLIIKNEGGVIIKKISF